MQFIPYIILGILGIVLLILCLRQRKRLKNAQARLEELMQKQKKDLEDYYSDISARATQKFEKEKTSYENQLSLLRIQLNEKKKAIDSNLEIYRKGEYEKLDREIQLKKYRAFQDANDVVKIFENEATENIEKTFSRIAEARSEYDEILEILEDHKKRLEVINEINRKEEELQNELDSHRIILKDIDKNDINYLLSIEENINNKDLLHKLIWSEYLQKNFNSMLNKIFGSRIPKNVIYCIENYKTHKKYIGKTSAEVSKRWSEHVKTSLNIGGVKKQNIHEALFKRWDDFTFSILEEVPENIKLGEREKYWINFFETDKFGYNIKNGG